MKRMFMFDIETTGTNIKEDDILQLGLLELTYEEGMWKPGKQFVQLIHSDKTPQDAFAKKYMAPLYARCNEAPVIEAEEVRSKLVEFLKVTCGGGDLPILAGLNAAGFDVPFAVEKKYLIPTKHNPETNKLAGDFHYRVYEVTGAIEVACDVTGLDRRAVLKTAEGLGADVVLPVDLSSHDAIFDCYNQTRILNGVIRLLRNPNSKTLGE